MTRPDDDATSMRVSCCAALFLATLGACQGVSLRPETANADLILPVSLSLDSSRELAGRVDRAIDAVVRRRYDEAKNEAQAALSIDPRCARARAVLGRVLLQEAALSEPPDLFRLNAGEHEIRLALQIAPDDAFVGYMWAEFLAESGHWSAAADAAESALARAEKAPAIERAALLGIAGQYRYELGEERAALPHLQAYVSLRPDDAAASFRIGSCLLRIARVPLGPKPRSLEIAQASAEAASRAFARCAELAPGDEDAALSVGAALVRAAELAIERREPAIGQQRFLDAEQQYREVATRFPANAESLFCIGVLAEGRGAFDQAGEAYAQALLRDAEHLGSLLNLAALSERATIVGAPAVRDLLLRAAQVDAKRGGLSAEERRRIDGHLRGG